MWSPSFKLLFVYFVFSSVAHSQEPFALLSIPNPELRPYKNFENRADAPYPFSTVGRVYSSIYPMAGPTCSGTLVAKNKVLTAQHCILNSYTGEILKGLGFALDSGKKALVKTVIRAAGYNFAQHKPESDIALLVLAEPLGEQAGFLPVFSRDLKELMDTTQDFVFQISGYPAYANLDNRIPRRPWKYVSAPVCKIERLQRDVLFNTCAPSAGVSGGAFMYQEPQSGIYWLVGVVSSQWQRDLAGRVYGSVVTGAAPHRWLIDEL